MKKFLTMLAIAATLSTTYIACDEDDAPGAPKIEVPTSTSAKIGSTSNFTFEVMTPGGYESSTVESTSGDVEIVSEPSEGEKSGEVVVAFTAPAEATTAIITLAVYDAKEKITTTTVEVTVSAYTTITKTGVISASENWTKDNIYILNGRVIVDNGATLTIEAGTVIKGAEGQASNASALMIARGAKIAANGTAEEPIIMTSVLDNILPGQKSGTSLTASDRGKWGGLVILGKAPISVAGDNQTNQIEGVPASETRGLYGGTDAADNSGTINYVSIRYGGTIIAEGSEINGLTLGGVGSATTISNVEVYNNEDDGVEFFGGTVNVSNIIISYQGDDAIDIDQAYKGTVDGFYVIHGGSTDKGLEIDGPEGTVNTADKFTLKNGTLVGDPTRAADLARLGDFKSKAQGTVQNVIFKGYNAALANQGIWIQATYSAGCVLGTGNAYNNLIANNLVFNTVQLTGYNVKVTSSNATNCATPNASEQTAAEGKVVSATVSTGIPAVTTWDWTVSKEKSLIK